MRSISLFCLAFVASLAIAAPIAQDAEDIIPLIPIDDINAPLGPESGKALPAAELPASVVVAAAVEQSEETDPLAKRDLGKRYTLTLPAGYFFAFKNLTGATQTSSYKTYKSFPANTPDLAKACTDFCDRKVGCTFANLYTEKFGPNPEDELIKCSIYSLPSGPAQATNTGQFRNNYHVTIRESYGFSKELTPVLPGWTEEKLDGAINGKRADPSDPDPYMGFATIAFTDPDLCAQACDTKTAYNSRHPSSSGSYRACNFFNFYILKKNGVPFKTVCSFYLISFDSSFATNHGYTNQDEGAVYTIGDSWSFTKNSLIGVGGIVGPVQQIA